MNNYVTIADAIPRLQRDFDWTHSFVRELYVSTLRCYQRYKNSEDADAIGEAWFPHNVRMVVAVAGNATVFAIEFLCLDVEEFSVRTLNEMSFDCRHERNRVILDLAGTSTDDEMCMVAAKEILVAFLDEEYLGPWLRLGHENPREDAINATKIDQCWRQCENCCNAWIERPDVHYSRCPECGELTRLCE